MSANIYGTINTLFKVKLISLIFDYSADVGITYNWCFRKIRFVLTCRG